MRDMLPYHYRLVSDTLSNKSSTDKGQKIGLGPELFVRRKLLSAKNYVRLKFLSAEFLSRS